LQKAQCEQTRGLDRYGYFTHEINDARDSLAFVGDFRSATHLEPLWKNYRFATPWELQ